MGLSQNLANDDEQNQLDRSLDEALSVVDFNHQLDPMVQKAVAVLQACSSYEEASEQLANLYPELESEQHHRYLANALFLSDLLGVASVKG